MLARCFYNAQCSVYAHARRSSSINAATPTFHVTTMSDVQYVSEWPPPEDNRTSPQKDTTVEDPPTSTADGDGIAFPPSKRAKHERSKQFNVNHHDTSVRANAVPTGSRWNEESLFEESVEDLKLRLSPDELRLVHSRHSVSTDVLLARWWKTRMMSSAPVSSQSSNSSEEGILSAIKSTKGPQSQIYHISR